MMNSTPASAMREPPIPNRCAPVRARRAVARRAAYMSLDASPAEIKISGGVKAQSRKQRRRAFEIRAGSWVRTRTRPATAGRDAVPLLDRLSVEKGWGMDGIQGDDRGARTRHALSIVGRQRMRESGRPGAGHGKRKFLLLVLKLIEAIVNS